MVTRCVLFKNVHDHGDGKLMAVPQTWKDFLKNAGEKLNVKAVKAFSENGGEIDDVALIRDNEKIFISEGEPFYKTGSSTGTFAQYNVAVFGSGGVGKSCLSMRYVRNTFLDVYDPTIEDAFRHQTVVDNICCIVDILDTAGQEDMTMLRRQWAEDRDGFLLTFSITEKSSFEDLHSFYDLIARVKGDTSKVPMVVVGNKADLADQREVSQKEAQDLAVKFGAPYIETSAKTGTNVVEAFETLIRAFLRLHPPKSPTLLLGSKKKGGCQLL